jgi:hypothetical protein
MIDDDWQLLIIIDLRLVNWWLASLIHAWFMIDDCWLAIGRVVLTGHHQRVIIIDSRFMIDYWQFTATGHDWFMIDSWLVHDWFMIDDWASDQLIHAGWFTTEQQTEEINEIQQSERETNTSERDVESEWDTESDK